MSLNHVVVCNTNFIPSLLPYFLTDLWKECSLKVSGDSRLTRKFQVTIPKDVRKVLKLDAGDLVVFVIDQRRVLLKRGEIKIGR